MSSDDLVPVGLPLHEPTVEVEKIGIALFSEVVRSFDRHAPRTAIEHDKRLFVARQGIHIRCDVVVWDQRIGARDLTFVGGRGR